MFFGAAVGQPAGIMQVNLFVPDPGASTKDAVYIGGAFLRAIRSRSNSGLLFSVVCREECVAAD